MIVRQFISWIRTAPAGERAEATRSLARAWLISDLTEDDRIAAEGALLMLLDDASPLVRQAMAEVFSRSTDAPAAIVQALAVDQPSVSLPILEHSPLLIDADLVDIVATGNDETQCAIARRVSLPASVCAAVAEVGTASAALELIENPYAELAPFSWDRIVERHGHLAAIREAMLVLEGLPAATRYALVTKLSDTLSQFVVARNWLSADRAGRIASEARDRPSHRRSHSAHIAVGQSRPVPLRARRTLRHAARPRQRAAARSRARQPAGAADQGGPAGIHFCRFPGGDRCRPGDGLCRQRRGRGASAPAHGRAGADPLRDRRPF